MGIWCSHVQTKQLDIWKKWIITGYLSLCKCNHGQKGISHIMVARSRVLFPYPFIHSFTPCSTKVETVAQCLHLTKRNNAITSYWRQTLQNRALTGHPEGSNALRGNNEYVCLFVCVWAVLQCFQRQVEKSVKEKQAMNRLTQTLDRLKRLSPNLHDSLTLSRRRECLTIQWNIERVWGA